MNVVTFLSFKCIVVSKNDMK